LGAVRRLAYEAADCGLLSADLAAGIRRVKGVRNLGVRLGNWLSDQQSLTLWQAPDRKDLKGKRDRALLALLLAWGLRRHEAVALRLEHLEQREEHWAIVKLKGKAGHVRTVSVPGWVMEELRVWLNASGIERGKIFRRVTKMGRMLGEGMTENAVWHICEGFREKDRSGEAGSSRPSTDLCPTLPCRRRRVGTDPVPFGPCLHSDNGTLSRLQAANLVGGQ
jgi:integrase